jgi:hypothetical protein
LLIIFISRICFTFVAPQAAASTMRKVDRLPTNLKQLIIESSQECFSVDIPRLTVTGDPSNPRCDGDPPRYRKRGSVAEVKKRSPCPVWTMMMTLSPPKRSAISKWMSQTRRRWVYNIAPSYLFQNQPLKYAANSINTVDIYIYIYIYIMFKILIKIF